MTYSTLISASVARNLGYKIFKCLISMKSIPEFKVKVFIPDTFAAANCETWNRPSDSPGTMTSLMTGLSKIKEDEATEFRMLRALGRKLDRKKKKQKHVADLDVWRTTGAQAITWCTMTFQKFSSKRSSVFCKTSLLDWECVIWTRLSLHIQASQGYHFPAFKMFSKVCLETTSGVCGITCAALGVAVTTTSWGVASRTLSSLGRKRDCQGIRIDVIIQLRKLCGLRDCKADGCDMMWHGNIYIHLQQNPPDQPYKGHEFCKMSFLRNLSSLGFPTWNRSWSGCYCIRLYCQGILDR